MEVKGGVLSRNMTSDFTVRKLLTNWKYKNYVAVRFLNILFLLRGENYKKLSQTYLLQSITIVKMLYICNPELRAKHHQFFCLYLFFRLYLKWMTAWKELSFYSLYFSFKRPIFLFWNILFLFLLSSVLHNAQVQLLNITCNIA